MMRRVLLVVLLLWRLWWRSMMIMSYLRMMFRRRGSCSRRPALERQELLGQMLRLGRQLFGKARQLGGYGRRRRDGRVPQ